MADTETISLTKILKNSKILVNVEEALQDILVVSYMCESKLYQGVLLDSTKKHLPCGVTVPAVAAPVAAGADEDKLFSLRQRFSYFQEKPPPTFHHVRRPVRPPARYKNARMTVRLRPRQVLCSKCRSICNENSENVDLSGARRPGAAGSERPAGEPPSRSPRPLFSENQRDNQPKVVTPAPSESPKQQCPPLVARLGEGANKIKLGGAYWVGGRDKSNAGGGGATDGGGAMYCLSFVERDPPPPVAADPAPAASTRTSDGDASDSDSDCSETDRGMVLRKKRSVGSMEDLWDESVFEDGLKRARTDAATAAAAAAAAVASAVAAAAPNTTTGARVTTPVIKISFGGARGEGTVLKIPAKVQGYVAHSESEVEETVSETNFDGVVGGDTKAARRALRKAKKEARRKMVPQQVPETTATVPTAKVGSATSLQATDQVSTPAAVAALYRRRHKHKVKHKKKHKEDRSRHGKDELTAAASTAPATTGTAPNTAAAHSGGDRQKEDAYSEIKERCLKQKLSISLKRLNANAYARCDFPIVDTDGSGAKSPAGSCTNSETSDDVPDFPPPGMGATTTGSASQPLTMRISTQAVTSCLTTDGRTMAVGDVVWGKIHGFPWWPGKVLSITVSRKDDGVSLAPQAHVAWYGSSTSSLMPCDQLSPFLETFKARYNKKKRGPYKEAIRQATCEARREEQPVLAITSSPREVNVVS